MGINREVIEGWFRDEFRSESEVKKSDALRVAMLKKTHGYLNHVMNDKNLHWTTKREMIEYILKMGSNVQNWIDYDDLVRTKTHK